jgi:hypothetical protein
MCGTLLGTTQITDTRLFLMENVHVMWFILMPAFWGVAVPRPVGRNQVPWRLAWCQARGVCDSGQAPAL